MYGSVETSSVSQTDQQLANQLIFSEVEPFSCCMSFWGVDAYFDENTFNNWDHILGNDERSEMRMYELVLR